MLKVVLQKVQYLPMYGQNIIEYTDLLTCLLGGKANDSSAKQNDTELLNKCLTSDV
jgi:E3 ubiquitin-protein ligase UBR4